MEVKTILQSTESEMQRALSHAKAELGKIRTGRASVSMLDSVEVDYYGSNVPIGQVANVSTPEATLIVVQPWEKGMLEPIEKAIQAANIGLNPSNDGQIIRLAVPPLNEERRMEIAKLAKNVAEESKLGVRHARKEAMDMLKKAEKDEHLSEDLRRDGEQDVQELTDTYVKQIDALYESKEQEIMTV
jgi:ribosome recycling factor